MNLTSALPRCARNSGSNGQMGYDESYCFDLQAARVGACAGVNLLTACLVLSALLSTFVVKLRLEATMGRIAAVFAGPCTRSHNNRVCRATGSIEV